SAAEIDQNGNPLFRPGLIDRLQDLLDTGTKAAVGIAAAEAQRHVAADHLAHHVGGAAGDVGGMRNNDDADFAGHARPSTTSQIASIMSSLERAPGSMCPIERSPRNEARPRMAFIGTVA